MFLTFYLFFPFIYTYNQLFHTLICFISKSLAVEICFLYLFTLR